MCYFGHHQITSLSENTHNKQFWLNTNKPKLNKRRKSGGWNILILENETFLSNTTNRDWENQPAEKKQCYRPIKRWTEGQTRRWTDDQFSKTFLVNKPYENDLLKRQLDTQPTFTCSKSTMKTIEQCVKSV